MRECLGGAQTLTRVELEKTIQKIKTVRGSEGQDGLEGLGLLDLELQVVWEKLYLGPVFLL